MYLFSLPIGSGPKTLLMAIVEAELAGHRVQASQRELGRMVRRDARTVRRWVHVLKTGGWVLVYRRAPPLTNVYRMGEGLSRRLAKRG